MSVRDHNKTDRLIMYDRIQRYRNEDHRSVSWIAQKLHLNRRTVKRYLSMSQAEYERHLDASEERPLLLEPYTKFVVDRLNQFQDTKAAQMHDWLKEHYPDFPEVCPKTVYNFVMRIRQEYRIPMMPISERVYECLPETPSGRYAQVDFGQTRLRRGDGTRVKVHFMVMLLCCSRYKFVWFSDRPFTSETASQAHEKSFEYFRGVPRFIIYDQDAVFLYDEHLGDYRMTTVFESYVKSRPFDVIFCRPADPQSKGKVENAVKYVKQNFLLNRQFSTIDNLNAEAEAWLRRTGNAMTHGTTRKVPYEEWCNECKDLQPYIPMLARPAGNEYTVIKDNTIKFHGNIYSLPLGTYKGDGTKVYTTVDGADLIIKDRSGCEIARHIIPAGSGIKVQNRNHRADRSVKVAEYCRNVSGLFTDKEAIAMFLDKLKERYPRYMRDQLITIHSCYTDYGQPACDAALARCLKNHLYSANFFKETVSELAAVRDVIPVTVKPLGDGQSRMMANINPGTSDIRTYERLFKQA